MLYIWQMKLLHIMEQGLTAPLELGKVSTHAVVVEQASQYSDDCVHEEKLQLLSFLNSLGFIIL